ncbi:hypothetical protein ACIBJI_01205 [Nocardia sp. NPDC050408]|uniref:hypothetical protein n=1 Tax=Nocardia sp. NPDC050408 TaxID=3364319 RepID=UPI00379EC957
MLGAFVGLRIAEAAGLRFDDVDFDGAMVYPQRQWPDKPLETKASYNPLPIPAELVDMLETSAARSGTNLVCDELCKPVSPWVIGWNLRGIKDEIPGLPEGAASRTSAITTPPCCSARAPTSRRFRPEFATEAP